MLSDVKPTGWVGSGNEVLRASEGSGVGEMSVNFDIRGSQASTRPPICAICTPGDDPRIVMVQKGKGIRHWPNEGHIKRDTVPESPIKRTESVPEKTDVPNKRGRPKRWKSEAARKAAYRERKAT